MKPLRWARWVGLVAGSLAGVLAIVGSDITGGYAVFAIPVAAVFAGWMDWRTGATRRQAIASGLLSVGASFGFMIVAIVFVALVFGVAG